MKDKTTGTIFLPTASALALWEHEITGQLSDGMWENASPHDHWQFWCRLEHKLDVGGPPRVETQHAFACRKTGYNIAALYEYVESRMIALGRLGLAQASIVADQPLTYEQRVAAENMPADSSGMVGYHAKAASDPRFAAAISPTLASAYYSTIYEKKHLRADVALIKRAMKTVKG